MTGREQKEFGIVLGTDRVKVYTYKGIQVHRSQRAYVYLRGERTPVKCCGRIHLKGSAARKCGERTAKWLLAERAQKEQTPPEV